MSQVSGVQDRCDLALGLPLLRYVTCLGAAPRIVQNQISAVLLCCSLRAELRERLKDATEPEALEVDLFGWHQLPARAGCHGWLVPICLQAKTEVKWSRDVGEGCLACALKTASCVLWLLGRCAVMMKHVPPYVWLL